MSNQLLGSSTSQTTNYVKSRNQSLPSSTRARTTPKSSRSSSLYQKKCIFCKPTASKKTSQASFATIISKALYSKYAASQNYHYTRLVNDILLGAKTSKAIEFQDWECYDEEEEYLKRFYQLSEYNMKLKTLTEYYKYHKDIARMFMRPVTDILNKYHDKKRRIEYIRITKLLQEEEQEGSIAKHEGFGVEAVKESLIVDRVLDDLDKSNFNSKNSEARVTFPSVKGTQSIYINESIKSDLVNKYLKDQAAQKVADKNEENTLKKSHELSVSNTIQELNLKLGEIINSTNSPFVNLDVPNFLETGVYKQDNILSGLVENVRRKQKTKNPVNIVNIDLVKPTQPSPKATLCTSPVNCKTEYGVEDDHMKVRTLIKSQKDEKLEGSGLKTAMASVIRKSHRKIPNSENKETQEDENSFVMLSTERLATRKNSLVKEKPRKKTPSITKIKGFEEAFAMQQQGSLSKANSQRSLSGDKARKKSKINSTRKHIEEKLKIKDERFFDAVPSLKRRESQMNSKDLSKSGANTDRKEKSASRCSVTKQKQPSEIQDLKTKKSSRPSSHKKMRITVDINHSGKHPSQHISFNNSNLTGTGKAISLASQPKGFSRNLNNFNVKITSDKALTSRTALKSDRETKTLLGLEQTVKKEYQDFIAKKIKLHSRLSSRERSNSNEKSKSKGSEDGIVTMKKSTEQFYEKIAKRRTSNKNFTQHTKTKSEESLNNKQNLTEKPRDPSKTQRSHQFQQLKSEEDKNVLEDKGDQKHVYTYNNSNVVNIFVQPGDKMLVDEPFVIITKNDRPKSTMRHESRLKKPAAGDNDIKKHGQNQCEKLQDLCDEYKYERTSKSPLKSSRKSKPKLSKSKSGTLEPFGRTTSFPQNLREECL